jgi:hypothetical protein
MSTWRRPPAPRPVPPRTPHPDPGRELQLQRILGLQAAIGRQEELIAAYREQIGELNETACEESSAKRAELYFQQAGILHERITETEKAIRADQAEIAVLQAEIPADDLAFL